MFGDKYTVIMVEDEVANAESGGGFGASPGLGSEGGASRGPRASGAAARAQELNTPRVAFQIVPTAQATPPQARAGRGEPHCCTGQHGTVPAA
jgi:hypothetical protein